MPLAAAPALAHGGHGEDHRRGHSIPRENISIQLYTLRDQMAADTQGTLNALARIGYRAVEHAGFVGRTATEFKAMLRNAGLRATSGHQGIPQPYDAAAWQAQIRDALTIGQRYIVNPASPITFFPTDGDLSKIRGLPTAAAWRAYAAVAPSEFEAKSSVVTERLAKDDANRPLNALVRAAFVGKPPKTMQEVASRYADLLCKFDKP